MTADHGHAQPTQGERRILLVDDDFIGNKVRAEVCRGWGFCVETASSGHEALALVQREQFHGIIVDYDMPDMNGIEFALKLSMDGSTIPMVMLSGRLDLPNEQGRQLLSAFVSKGQGPEVLLYALNTLIGEPRT